MTFKLGARLIEEIRSIPDIVDHARAGLIGEDAYFGAPVSLTKEAGFSVSFERARPVRYFVLENTVPPSQPRDCELTVRITTRDRASYVAYHGSAMFGDGLWGLPLILDLGPGAKVIKCEVTATHDLDLGPVRFFGPPRHDDKIRFVETRFDGLCQRLTTLLNAVQLAEVTGQDFAFVWQDDHLPAIDQQAISDINSIFTREFIQRHKIEPETLRPGMPFYTNGAHSEDQFDWLMAAAADHGDFNVDRPGKLTEIFPHLREKLGQNAEVRAFDSLGFTDNVRNAIDLARAVDLPARAIGLHLRAGDIVHGSHSNSGAYVHKAISIFEAEALVELAAERGRPLVLVGQEAQFAESLAARHDHVTATHRFAQSSGLDAVQGVLFDVVLLSRMDRIWGARSAVAALGAKLGTGRTTYLDQHNVLPGPEIFSSDPFAAPEYAGLNDNFKAFSAMKVAYMPYPSDWTHEHLQAARYALQLRPTNQFYNLVVAAMRFKFGNPMIGEKRLADMLRYEPEIKGAGVISNYLLSTDPPAPMEMLDLFSGADPEAQPIAHFLSALTKAYHARDRVARAQVREALDGGLPVPIRPALATAIERLIFGNQSGGAATRFDFDWMI